MRQCRLAGLGLADGDAVRFSKATQRLSSLRIVHAAAGDDDGCRCGPQRLDGALQLYRIGLRAPQLPNAGREETPRIAASFRLYVLAQRQHDEATRPDR